MTEEEKIKMQKLYCDEKQQVYDELLDLAEIDEFELDATTEECDRAEYMLEKVMRYGTYADSARAIGYFVKFMHAVDELKHVL